MSDSPNPVIELRLWRQFAAVAEDLHFGRAAIRLHMTQPPLTQAIAQLESLLGVRLFDRTKRSVQLTEAGQALLPEVHDLLARSQAIVSRARSAAAGESGSLRLAFVSTVGFELLPRWIQEFRTRFPNVSLDLLEATGDLQLQALERGEIDAGFMLHAPGFTPAGLGHHIVTTEPLVLALPARHALAKAPRLTLPKVLSEPLVMFPRRIVPSLHDAIFALYHANGRSPQVVQEAIQMQTIVNLVSAGLGLAWVPESVTRFQREGVVYRQMAPNDKPVLMSETSLVWNTGNRNMSVMRFVECEPANRNSESRESSETGS